MNFPHAGAMLKARHAAERLQGAWHGGVSSIDQLRARMQDTLAEFVVSRDEAEVRHGSSHEVDRPHISFLWPTLIHRAATALLVKMALACVLAGGALPGGAERAALPPRVCEARAGRRLRGAQGRAGAEIREAEADAQGGASASQQVSAM